MNFTGERPVDTKGLDGSRMRYKSILPYCIGKNVLDYGCGTGLGSYMLSCFTDSMVMGYDPCKEAIEEAKKQFNGVPSLIFSNEADFYCIEVITLIEVLEHIEKSEVDSILRLFSSHPCDLVCTTPNGNVFPYQPKTIEERRGYHVWHYTDVELMDLFKRYYSFVDITGHVRDPHLNNFTGYTVFASNSLKWTDEWLTKIKV